MTTSETEIANLALTRIGHQMISSLTEGTPGADLCRLHYSLTRDALLRAHPWNFAIRRVALSLDGTTPDFEYSYRHSLPSDCLKVIRTNFDAEGVIGAAVYGFPGLLGGIACPPAWRVEGRMLLSNETAISIEYIARITDVTQFDELFVDAFADRLAAEIAPRLTDNQSMAKTMWEKHLAKLAEARSTDAQEGTARDVVDPGSWLMARV